MIYQKQSYRSIIERIKLEGTAAVLKTLSSSFDIHAAYQEYLNEGGLLINLASALGQVDSIDFLIKSGVSPDSVLISERDSDNGLSPLWVAADFNQLSVVKYLIKAGVEIDKPVLMGLFKGFTPIFIACALGHHSVVRALLEAGADFRAPLSSGKFKGVTPLAIACRYNRWQVADMLISHNSSPTAPLITGRYQRLSPLLIAFHYRYMPTINCIAHRLLEANLIIDFFNMFDTYNQHSGTAALKSLIRLLAGWLNFNPIIKNKALELDFPWKKELLVAFHDFDTELKNVIKSTLTLWLQKKHEFYFFNGRNCTDYLPIEIVDQIIFQGMLNSYPELKDVLTIDDFMRNENIKIQLTYYKIRCDKLSECYLDEIIKSISRRVNIRCPAIAPFHFKTAIQIHFKNDLAVVLSSKASRLRFIEEIEKQYAQYPNHDFKSLICGCLKICLAGNINGGQDTEKTSTMGMNAFI